jgi:hypothetical protein
MPLDWSPKKMYIRGMDLLKEIIATLLCFIAPTTSQKDVEAYAKETKQEPPMPLALAIVLFSMPCILVVGFIVLAFL